MKSVLVQAIYDTTAQERGAAKILYYGAYYVPTGGWRDARLNFVDGEENSVVHVR